MRIVYLNKIRIDDHLPAVNFTFHNAYGLAQAGAICYLIVQRSDASDGFDLHEQLAAEELARLKLIVLPRSPKWGIDSNQWFYIEAVKRIKALHAERPLQAVISRDPGALPYLAYLRRRSRLAVFYQPHNFYVDLAVRPDLGRKNTRKYHLLERRFIGKMSAVLCLQGCQAGWYRKYFPDHPILVSPPGILQIDDRAPNQFAQRLIGYVGSLQGKKGIESLLTAMQQLKSDFRLRLVGGRTPAEIAPVRQRIQSLGLGRAVEITGWIPYSAVARHLRQISVGVVPLTDIFYNRFLTAPNKLFDYLSRGIPVVAADLPAVREFMSEAEGGIFFDPDSPDGIAAAIRDLFASRQEYDRRREAIRALARRHLWSDRGARMITQIAEIVKAESVSGP